jgi:hypothetical protein
VVGPDGVGKTTLIDGLAAGFFSGAPLLMIRDVGVLPRRATPGVPVTEPHADPPYSFALSIAKVGYLFVDYLLGWVLTVRRFVRKGGWIVVQRGWWDLAVDPVRYRLAIGGRLMRALGRLLPQPSLIIVLEADPELIHKRKPELSLEELSRQQRAWRELLPPRLRCVWLDASRPAPEVLAEAERELTSLASGGSGSSSVALPRPGQPRFIVPREPARVARRALSVYHPVTVKGLVGWRLAGLLAGAGGMRFAPSGDAPEPISEMLASRFPSARASVARTNHPRRFAALVLSPEGEPVAAVKLALDAEGRAALAREAEALRDISPALKSPLRAPRLIESQPGLIVLEAIRWRPRPAAWRLPKEVATAMGAFYRGTALGQSRLAHGDFAPWNLLETSRGWVLIDWEEAHAGAASFFDLFHYVVQASALLGRPSRSALLRGLEEGAGWVGAALTAYCAAAGLDAGEAAGSLAGYLETSSRAIDPSTPDARRGLEARHALLEEVAGR